MRSSRGRSRTVSAGMSFRGWQRDFRGWQRDSSRRFAIWPDALCRRFDSTSIGAKRQPMCGICGIVQISGSRREVAGQDDVDRMTRVMTPRGPDDSGSLVVPGVALGVRRLSIIDVANGSQPVSNEDESVWAVLNGEFYNHRAIAADLVGSRAPPSEPVRYRGPAPSLRADARRPSDPASWRVRLCRLGRSGADKDRDTRGIVWASSRSTMRSSATFSSSHRSSRLFASRLIDPKLDVEAIDAYLTLGYFAGPTTPLRQVRKLEPAHRLIVDGSVRIERYWTFPHPDPDPAFTEESAREALLGELEESVKMQLMSDVPARRDAERRPRLEPARCFDGTQHERTGQYILRRIRRGCLEQ